jgi:hypothetical protein
MQGGREGGLEGERERKKCRKEEERRAHKYMCVYTWGGGEEGRFVKGESARFVVWWVLWCVLLWVESVGVFEL